jgi:predicted MFS family arabinose efflux permease
MTAAPSPRRRLGNLVVDPTPLRLDRDFRLLWTGQAISTVGRMVTSVVLPFQVYVLTHDLLMLGALSLVQLVPILIFALGGGAIADAVDRRRLLLVTQLGLAATSLGLMAIALLPAPPIWGIFSVAFFAAGIGAVDQPARGSAIPRLVPAERLPAAISLNQIVFNGAAVIGPAFGGVLLALTNVAACYLFDVVTFGAAIAAVLMIQPIPPHPGASRPSVGAIAEGLRFARSRRPVLATFIVDINAMVFGSPRSLFAPLALDVFRVGPAGVGLMSAAAGLGALIASVFSGWTTTVQRPGRAVLIAVAFWSLGIVGFGLSVFSFPLALLFLAIASGADVFSAVLRSAIVQLLTPDSLRGRVSSIHILVVTGGPRVGDAEASVAAALIGTQWSVVSGGVLSLLGVGLLTLAMPEFSRLRMAEARAAAERDAAAMEDRALAAAAAAEATGELEEVAE